MQREQLEMTLSPIGYVSVDQEGFSLRIDAPYRPALRGLEGFSHIDVLWWCNQVDAPDFRRQLECDQPYKKGPAKMGLFATRLP
jgi:tRNA (Thr-GGU) A37 N-methylase